MGSRCATRCSSSSTSSRKIQSNASSIGRSRGFPLILGVAGFGSLVLGWLSLGVVALRSGERPQPVAWL